MSLGWKKPPRIMAGMGWRGMWWAWWGNRQGKLGNFQRKGGYTFKTGVFEEKLQNSNLDALVGTSFCPRPWGSKGMGEWFISAEGDGKECCCQGDPVAKTEGCQKKVLDFSQHLFFFCRSEEIFLNNEILFGDPTGYTTKGPAALRMRIREPSLHDTNMVKENVQELLFLWNHGRRKDTHFKAGMKRWGT